MATGFSLSRTTANTLAGGIAAVLNLLGPRRALKIRSLLATALVPTGVVQTGNGGIRLTIADRRCLYWLHQGLGSEPETLAWIGTMERGQILYDVGANVGLYSMYAAQRGIACVAVEPNPFSFSALCRNLLLNGMDGGITPLCLALGSKATLARLGIASPEAGAVGSTLAGDNDKRPGLQMPCLTLDLVSQLDNLPFPQHIKIDVDGIERDIVEGGQKVWADARLRSVLIETMHCSTDDRQRIDAILAGHGLLPSPQDSSALNTVYRRTMGVAA